VSAADKGKKGSKDVEPCRKYAFHNVLEPSRDLKNKHLRGKSKVLGKKQEKEGETLPRHPGVRLQAKGPYKGGSRCKSTSKKKNWETSKNRLQREYGRPGASAVQEGVGGDAKGRVPLIMNGTSKRTTNRPGPENLSPKGGKGRRKKN